jgi:hypothetical protein
VTQECGEIRRLLGAWIDGELSSADRRRVARHVEDCPGCQDEAEALGGLDVMLSADNEAGDPGDAYFGAMRDRIAARFDFDDAARRWARPEAPQRNRRLAVPRAWIPRFAFGFAGAAVVVIAFLLVKDIGNRPILAPSPRVVDTIGQPPTAETPVARSVTPPATPAPEPATSIPEPATPARKPAAAPAGPPGSTGSPANPAEPTLGMRVDVSRAVPERVPEQAPPIAPEDGGAKVAPSLEPHPPAPTPSAPGLGEAPPPVESPPENRQELLAYFGSLIETDESPAPLQTEGASDLRVTTERSKSLPGEAGPAGSAKARSVTSYAEERPARPAGDERPEGIDAARRSQADLPDSAWVRQGRALARSMADSALAAGTPEGCKNALRAYWRMLHRDGRALFPERAARANALEPDRLRIVDLLHCASR